MELITKFVNDIFVLTRRTFYGPACRLRVTQVTPPPKPTGLHLNHNCFDEFKINGLENSIQNYGSYNDFDSITTTYAEDQKQIIDKPKLDEHSEPIYDAVSASFTVKQDITQQVDEHNHEKINISQLPNINIRSYTIRINLRFGVIFFLQMGTY